MRGKEINRERVGLVKVRGGGKVMSTTIIKVNVNDPLRDTVAQQLPRI